MSKHYNKIAIAVLAIASLAMVYSGYSALKKQGDAMLGITALVNTDTGSTSMAVINANFAELEADKLEHSDMSGGTGITYSSGAISFDCSEVEGTGINCATEAITLDATGDWTGTFDGLEGSAYFALSDWLATTTDGLDQGSTNLYWSQALFDAALLGTTTIDSITSLPNLVGGEGTGTVNSGTTGQIPYYASDGTTLSGTSTIKINPNGNIILDKGAGTSPGLYLINGDDAFGYINKMATESNSYLSFSSEDGFKFSNSVGEDIYITGGQLGIGSSSPNFTLDVDGTINASGNITGGNLNISNWDTAYGWGDHGSAGYLGLSAWYSTTTHALLASLPSLTITESQISDFGTYLTAVSSDSDWTDHNNYPSACSAGQYVSGIGDTLTCGTPSGSSSGTSTPYITVCASDSQMSFSCNYTADGTADQVQIQAAIDGLPTNGGVVVLSDGTFNTDDEIFWDKNAVTLMGQGVEATEVACSSSTVDAIRVGTRQAGGTYRKWNVIRDMTVNSADDNTTKACIKIDGGGEGTEISRVKTVDGKHGLQLMDIDRGYFSKNYVENPNTSGFSLEQGLENTMGTITFDANSVALNATNTIGMEIKGVDGQEIVNYVDRVNITSMLFYTQIGAGITGTIGLKATLGVHSLTVQNSIFENNETHVNFLDESYAKFLNNTFMNTGGTSTNAFLFENDTHLITVEGCRFQQATNLFNGDSGWTQIYLQGGNKNNGDVENVWTGQFGYKSGLDFIFAGSYQLQLGSDSDKINAGYFNNLSVAGTFTAPSGYSLPLTASSTQWNTAYNYTQKNALFKSCVASTSIAFASAGNFPLPQVDDAYTITNIRCNVVGGINYSITITDGTNATESITCTTSGANDDGSITNASVTAGEQMYLDFGTASSSPNYLCFSIYAE